MKADELVKKGLSAKRESKYVEFKSEFDPASGEAWCDVIKEIVAISNTAGGILMIGLDNRGNPTGADVSAVRSVDPAVFTDKIRKYTGHQFTSFELVDCEKGGAHLLAIVVQRSDLPIVFEKPGTYAISSSEQRTAFSRGTVYFRHGAKSEPGITADLQSALERRLEMIRGDWLSGIRKVVYADPGSEIAVFPREVIQTDLPGAPPIRLSDDPAAPVYRLESPDSAYPYRQKEVLREVNKRLTKGRKVNQYDLLSVRRVYNVNEETRFAYESKFASPQYSEAFVDWLVHQRERDPDFFERARRRYYLETRGKS